MSDCVGRVSCFKCLKEPGGMQGEGIIGIPVQKCPEDERIYASCRKFAHHYGFQPHFHVKVPGRVNLIGEHIDYCGFPVLPMAMEQDILVTASITEAKNVIIKNTNGNKYPEFKISLKDFTDLKIEPDFNGKPFWYNYVLCGIKGALEYLESKFDFGLKILVDGNIPPASGLSSSSALVSASCVAFLHANNATISKTEIASLCANSERYIGTQGGGMDQAIAFLAEKNSAQYISFLPLKASPVALPENVFFVVAHSMVEANKAACNEFNTRVVECVIAAHVIATLEQIETGSKVVSLRDIKECRYSSFEEMIELVHKVLPQDNYTYKEVCDLLKLNENELEDAFLTGNTKGLKNFKLKQRALHVYGEALRVEKFRTICEESVTNDNVISTLGNLMAESHMSLKNLYECSHNNLDMLVDMSKKFGINARLTGAGWGGFIVAICPEEEVNRYIDFITDEFYIKLHNVERDDAYKFIFATSPNDGAVVYNM